MLRTLMTAMRITPGKTLASCAIALYATSSCAAAAAPRAHIKITDEPPQKGDVTGSMISWCTMDYKLVKTVDFWKEIDGDNWQSELIKIAPEGTIRICNVKLMPFAAPVCVATGSPMSHIHSKSNLALFVTGVPVFKTGTQTSDY